MKSCIICNSTALVRGSDLCLKCYSAQQEKESNKKAKRFMGHEEDNIQAEFISLACMLYPKLDKLLYHACNEGKRNPKRAKKIGIKSGVADIHLALANKKYHSLYIEFKTHQNKQTESQIEFQRQVEAVGNKYIVCYSANEAIDVLKEYLETSKYKFIR